MSDDNADTDLEWIHVSVHAGEKWQRHTDSPGVGPIIAWNRATLVEGHDQHADEVRYHHDTGLIMVRKQDTLVTVLRKEESAYETQEAIEQIH